MNAGAWFMAGLCGIGIVLALTSDAPKRVAGYLSSPQHVSSPPGASGSQGLPKEARQQPRSGPAKREASLQREAEIAAMLGIQPRFTEHVVEDFSELPDFTPGPCFRPMRFDGRYAADPWRGPKSEGWRCPPCCPP
jgi:hypothetical protein